jgi:hypothetical protein
MEGSQLRQIIQGDHITNHKFVNVFAANELPNLPSQSLAIVNCCNKNLTGLHWLALYKEGDVLEFFDTYGLHPNMYNLMGKLPQYNYLIYNHKRVQSLNSNVCGQYCLFFCYYKSRGFLTDDIMDRFGNDFVSNDNFVRDNISQIYEM